MQTRTMNRFLSLLLALILLMGMLPLQILAESPADPAGPADPATPPDEETEQGGDAERSIYYEVRFALPDEMGDLTPEEMEDVFLPETMMLPAGTPISSIEQPERLGFIFVGWYYDAALETRWAENDRVNRNMTLYPRFVAAGDLSDGMVVNYISNQDVPLDFPVFVAAYDLTEEETRALITVRDLNEFEGWTAFTLERQETDPADLIPEDEENRGAVAEALGRWQREGGSLGGALREAGAGDTTIAVLQANCAPDELRADAEAVYRALLSDAGFGTGAPSEDLTALTQQLSRKRDTRNAFAKALGIDTAAAAKAQPAELRQMFVDALLAAAVKKGGIRVRTVYRVRPEAGAWTAGHLFQVELKKTDSLRYVRGGTETNEYVVYYNLTAAFEPFNNMRLKKGLAYIPAADVDGVDLNDGLLRTRMGSDDMTVEPNDTVGVLTSARPLEVGGIIVVYEGELREDGSADRMGYFRITGDLGDGKYAYGIPDFMDVVFMPDVIPVPTDGSYEDGEIFVQADQLDFTHPAFAEIGLGEDTEVEEGDWIALYTGSLDAPDNAALVGYGELTAVSPAPDGLLLRYELRTEEDMVRLAGMSMREENLNVNLTDEEIQRIGSDAVRSIEENGFFDQAMEYVASLIFSDKPEVMEDEVYRNALQQVRFTTDEGEELSLEEVRKLNLLTDRITDEDHADLHCRFTVSMGLQHFSGTGVRFELSASTSWKYDFEAFGEGTKDMGLNVDILIQLEQEVSLGCDLSFGIDWGKAWFIKYPKDVKGAFALTAGTFTAIGFQITVGTRKRTGGEKKNVSQSIREQEAEKHETRNLDPHVRHVWYSNLTDAAGELDDIVYNLDYLTMGSGWDSQEQDPNTHNYRGTHMKQHDSLGGSVEEKYAIFVKKKSEYVPFWKYDILDKDLAPDPLHLCAIGFKISVQASFRLSVVFGASLSYGNCKRWTINFKVLEGTMETSTAETEQPNMNVGVYLFGLIGARFGFVVEFRLGLISTKLASVGAVLDFGLYAEFYGFFYFGYRWESEKGGNMQMLGSMLFDIGFYLSVKLKAQAGNDRKKAETEVFSMRVPFISLGDQLVMLDFNIEQTDKKLDVKLDGNSIKMPDELYELKTMGMANGAVDKKSMDGDDRIPSNKPDVISFGKPYPTWNEDFFEVECVDTDENGQSLGTSSWTYDPETNTVTARPKDDTVEEMWGEITFTFRNLDAKTFKNYVRDKRFGSYCSYGVGIGINSRTIARTVKVHWIRQDTTLTVENFYQICPDAKIGSIDDFNTPGRNEHLREWYERGDKVNLTVPAGVEHGVSLTDPRLKHKADFVPAVIYSNAEIVVGSGTDARDRLRKALAGIPEIVLGSGDFGWIAGGTDWYVWVSNPKGEMWQVVPPEGRTIRIYYNYTGSSLPHRPADPVQENVVEATCTQEGSYDEVVRCKICEKAMSVTHKTTEKLPHTPQDPVQENVKEATCTEEGSYDEVVYCSVCHGELSRTPKTVEKKPHTPDKPVQENYVDSTCAKEGSYDEVVYCSACHEELSRTPKTVEKKPHTPDKPVRENFVDSTCAKEGSYDEVVYCSACHEELSRTQKTVEKKPHTPDKPVRENFVDSTCAKEGSYDEVVYCSVCHEELSRTPKTVEKKPHTPDKPVRENFVDSTCAKEGSYDEVVYCSVCREELSRTPKTVEKKPHTPDQPVRENVVDATCTKDGSYDEVVYCSACHEELSRTPKTIPMTGHDMHTTETPAQPIMEDGRCVGWKPGETVTACSRCDEKTVETHPVETQPAVDAVTWSYREGTLSVSMQLTDVWESATVADYLAKAGFYGYAGTLDDDTCFAVDGAFTADKGGDTALADHPDETLSVPVTFTPDDAETYAGCSFTLALTVVTAGCPYVDENGTPETAFPYSQIREMPTDGTASGWYAVDEDFVISDRLIINGEVNLILCDDKTLECASGIQLSGGSLTVWGQAGNSGLLECTGQNGDAGIGGGAAGPMGGSLTVHSGQVRSRSMSDASGIGGGQGQNGGTVTILGGWVVSGAMGSDCPAIGAGVGGTDNGKLTLGDELMAKTGNFTVFTDIAHRDERVAACQRDWGAIISSCDHSGTEYVPVDRKTHLKQCAYCMHVYGEEEHTFDETGSECTLCGCRHTLLVHVKWHISEDKAELLTYEVNMGEPFGLNYPVSGFGNYEFRGWNLYENKSPDDVVSFLPAEGMEILPGGYSQPVTCDLVAMAVFGTPCTVTFSPGRGSGTMAPRDWYTEDPYPLPACGYDAPDGAAFAGWLLNGSGNPVPAGKTVTLTGDTVLTAAWEYDFGTPDMTLPGGVREVEASAFEGMPVKAVWIGDGCASVSDFAFRGCTGLTRIRLPKDCRMGEDVLAGCGAVVIFAPTGGTAEAWALSWIAAHPDCAFQAE